MSLLAPVAGGCGSDRPQRGEGTVQVVTSTATLADLVQNAGGRRVEVQSLVPRFAYPHDWRPGAGTAAALEDADLVVMLGGELDAWLAAPLERGGPARELVLLPQLDPLADDSHWWQDPVRVQRAVKLVRNELARVDVDGAGYYEAAAAEYLERLRRLDDETGSCLAAVRSARERIVAQHSGFAYFTDRYGIEIVGPRAGRGALGRRLWADTLGPPGSRAESYLGAFALNLGVIVRALSDGERSCRPRV